MKTLTCCLFQGSFFGTSFLTFFFHFDLCFKLIPFDPTKVSGARALTHLTCQLKSLLVEVGLDPTFVHCLTVDTPLSGAKVLANINEAHADEVLLWVDWLLGLLGL